MMNHRTVLLVLFALAAACTYDPTYEVSCDEEGARDGNRVCENGIWLVSETDDVPDADSNNRSDGVDDPDMDLPDGSMPDADMNCTPEANVDFCARLGFDCEEVTAPDNCGVERTITCGTCEAPQTCGAVEANVCGCVPEDAATFCTRLVKTCDMVTDLDNCGVERTQDCGACTAPAECGGGGTPNVCACPDQTDADFCMEAGAVCGAYTGIDECGVNRTVSCGTCTSPETCNAETANQCDCPDDAAVCTALSLECGTSDVSMVCGNKATVDCGGCQANATCAMNTCACDSGYMPDGLGNCEDIDECGTSMDNCATDATCANTPGSFTCTCNAGYMGDGVTCADVDECAAMTDNCDQNATCTNNRGGFDCACNSGYTGNGQMCADVDECATMMDNCDQNATCANTPGSFTCTCNPGYAGGGQACADIDECLMADICDPNATCTNEPGSYDCTCNPGFTGDGMTCTPDALVVSVQTVLVILTDSETSDSASLPTQIDSANAVAFVSVRSNSGELQYNTVDVVLSDTDVDVSRPDNDQTMVVAVSVVEFDPARVRVQTGSFSGQGNTSITTIDPTASFVTFTGGIDHNNDEVDNRMLSGNFSAGNNALVIGRESTGGSLSGHYWIAESLDGGFNVQHLSGGITDSNSSTSLTIPTAVDTTSSFVLYSYQATETGTDLDDGVVACELTNATTVDCVRNGSSEAITNLRVQVVEVSGAAVQRGASSVNSGDSTSAQLSSVDLAKSHPNLGQTGSSGACRTDQTSNNGFPSASFTLSLADATTLEVGRGLSGSGSSTCTWEVIEWP